jgi:hypothetical protein
MASKKINIRWTTSPTRRHPPSNSDEQKKILQHVESQRSNKDWHNGARVTKRA